MPKFLTRGVFLTLGAACLLWGTAAAQEPPPATGSQATAPRPPAGLTAKDTPNDAGHSIDLSWTLSPDDTAGARSVARYVVSTAATAGGPFAAKDTVKAGTASSQLTGIPDKVPVFIQVSAANAAGAGATSPVEGISSEQWWNSDRSHMFWVLLLYSAAFFFFLEQAKRGKNVFVRRIPGLAAMEEAIGRATEMGRPVLYVPGVSDMKEIQTICSMVILGDVAKLTARYDTPLIVPCADAVVLSAAEEKVRGGYADAGKPEAYDPNNVVYLSNEQFAFVAGITGIMNRQKPATVIYMGSFFAESLMLAETGFAAGAVQIAGTANVHQIPFFVVACDYTLIGEELYAASAYLSQEPELLGSLKAADLTKIVLIALIVVGAVLLFTTGNGAISNWFVAN